MSLHTLPDIVRAATAVSRLEVFLAGAPLNIQEELNIIKVRLEADVLMLNQAGAELKAARLTALVEQEEVARLKADITEVKGRNKSLDRLLDGATQALRPTATAPTSQGASLVPAREAAVVLGKVHRLVEKRPQPVQAPTTPPKNSA